MQLDLANRRALRFALGVAPVFILSQGIGWPIGFLGALFTAMFLQMPMPLPFGAALKTLAVAFTLSTAGLVISSLLLSYPPVLLIAIGIGLLITFRYTTQGGSPFVTILALIALLLVPVLAMSSIELAAQITIWLVINLAIGLAVAGLMFLVLPADQESQQAAAPSETALDSQYRAIRMTVVTFPLAVAFFWFGWSSVLVLIFTAVLAQQLGAATTLRAGLVLLIANFAGGISAIVIYEVLVMAPNFVLMSVLMLAICGLSGSAIFSGKSYAPLVASGLNTTLILLGGAMAPFGDDADAKFGDRIGQIAMAVIYVIIAFEILSSIWQPKDAVLKNEIG